MTRSQRRCIAVLGADGTGKNELVLALAESFRLTGQRVDVALADPTPLLAAVGSCLPQGAPSLQALALQHQTRYSHTLLMGLDVPWVADGPHKGSAAVRDQADARLRHALGQAGIAFQVIYGQGRHRLRNALSALGTTPHTPSQPASAGRWAWACDKCSDPACEHRLFTGLTGP